MQFKRRISTALNAGGGPKEIIGPQEFEGKKPSKQQAQNTLVMAIMGGKEPSGLSIAKLPRHEIPAIEDDQRLSF
jgi:microcystin-dependent protein